jgi:hypothetical protein
MENLKIIETFKRDKKFVIILAALSAIAWLVVSVGWPVFAGRDLGSYTMYFYWLFEPETPYRLMMCYRTILSSSVLGLLFLAGRPAASIFLLVGYVLGNLAFYYLGSLFGKKTARFFSLLMLVNFYWLIFFHEFSSDILLAIFTIFWAVYLVRVSNAFSLLQSAFFGAATFSLALVRPIAQIFVLVFLAPVWLKGVNKKSLISAAMILLVWLAGYFSYAAYNNARYGSFSLSRGANIHLPAYKVFIQDKAMALENGPASQKLAEAVEKDLLNKPVYQANKIDFKKFFSSGNSNMFYDLVSLSDRTWGWGDNYKIIRQAALEAVAKQPVKIIASSLKNEFGVFWENYNPPVLGQPEVQVVYNNPGSAPLISGSAVWWATSGSGKTAAEIKPQGWVSKIFDQANKKFIAPAGNLLLERTFSRIALLFPPIIFFLIFSLPLLRRLKEPKIKIIAVIFIPSILCAVIPVAMINSYQQFRLPFDFIFILAGIVGFFSWPRLIDWLEKILPAAAEIKNITNDYERK